MLHLFIYLMVTTKQRLRSVVSPVNQDHVIYDSQLQANVLIPIAGLVV